MLSCCSVICFEKMNLVEEIVIGVVKAISFEHHCSACSKCFLKSESFQVMLPHYTDHDRTLETACFLPKGELDVTST